MKCGERELSTAPVRLTLSLFTGLIPTRRRERGKAVLRQGHERPGRALESNNHQSQHRLKITTKKRLTKMLTDWAQQFSIAIETTKSKLNWIYKPIVCSPCLEIPVEVEKLRIIMSCLTGEKVFWVRIHQTKDSFPVWTGTPHHVLTCHTRPRNSLSNLTPTSHQQAFSQQSNRTCGKLKWTVCELKTTNWKWC